MAKTNHGRVGEALELLNDGLRLFVERELEAVYKDKWQEMARPSIRDNHLRAGRPRFQEVNWDTHNLLTVMWDQ